MRLLHQRAGDGDALLLAAREGLRPLAGGLRDVEPLERLERHELLLFGEDLQQAQHGVAAVEPAEHDVGEDVEPRHEVELLEDHGAVALPVAQGLPAQRRDHRRPRTRCGRRRRRSAG